MFRRHFLLLLGLLPIQLALLSSCILEDSEDDLPLRVYHNPYSSVDWETDLRLKGQHHDHTALNLSRIRAYDDAGYHALVMMDYSGDPDQYYSLRRRLWPAEDVLPLGFPNTLSNLRILIPAAEEIGARTAHATSPFMTTYIERWNPNGGTAKQSWQFEDLQEMVSMIRSFGGLPIVAHPWAESQHYEGLNSLFGAEIYSAFVAARRREGIPEFVDTDRERIMLTNWDSALARNQSIIGIAVNDHFGPYRDIPLDDDIRDSGKVIVLAKGLTLDAYQDAFQRGAILAIKDLGIVKDQYPQIIQVSVEETTILIDTTDRVTWISNGSVIETNNLLDYSTLPRKARYVRAQITNEDGSTIFTQAFWVRPVGDADGDGDVDAGDERICEAVRAGTESDFDRVDACD